MVMTSLSENRSPGEGFRLLLWLLLLLPGVAFAQLSAQLDHNRITDGETVQLTIEFQGETVAQPDATPLLKDFDLLDSRTSSSITIINGSKDARTTWTLTLSPKRLGRIEIPALDFEGEQSPALQLMVEKSNGASEGSAGDIFIEMSVEPDQAYVQGQVLVRVRLFHVVDLAGGSISDPKAEQALIRRLGKDHTFSSYRNGRRYQVIERRYAVFPQVSGKLELSAPVFNGQILERRKHRSGRFGNIFENSPFDDLFTSSRRIRLRGKTVSVMVLPPPATALGSVWLPAESLELGEEWQPETGEIHAGDPVTRTLTLRSRGLTGGQLPDLVPAAVDGFKLYPDKEEVETRNLEEGVEGLRKQKITFIPSRAGTLVLPAVRLYWWDTSADRQMSEELPERVVTVLPPVSALKHVPPSIPVTEPVPTVSPKPEVDTEESGGGINLAGNRLGIFAGAGAIPWPWISGLLALLWFITSMFLWREYRRGGRLSSPEPLAPTTDQSDGAEERRRFKQACRAGNPQEAAAALLEWSSAHWPEDPPCGLETVAERIESSAAREALGELNRCLYSTESKSWDGRRLSDLITQLPSVGRDSRKKEPVLPPLWS